MGATLSLASACRMGDGEPAHCLVHDQVVALGGGPGGWGVVVSKVRLHIANAAVTGPSRHVSTAFCCIVHAYACSAILYTSLGVHQTGAGLQWLLLRQAMRMT
jgi:hypothetical protein